MNWGWHEGRTHRLIGMDEVDDGDWLGGMKCGDEDVVAPPTVSEEDGDGWSWYISNVR